MQQHLTLPGVLTDDASRNRLEGAALHHAVYPQLLSGPGLRPGHVEPAKGRDLLTVGQHSRTYVLHHCGHRVQVLPPVIVHPSALHGTALQRVKSSSMGNPRGQEPASCQSRDTETKMALGRTLYNVFFRRTSTFFVTVLVGAVFLERAFDQGGDRMWERMNQGVSGQFPLRTLHIRIKDVECMCGGTVQGLQEKQLVDPALIFPTACLPLYAHHPPHLSTPC